MSFINPVIALFSIKSFQSLKKNVQNTLVNSSLTYLTLPFGSSFSFSIKQTKKQILYMFLENYTKGQTFLGRKMKVKIFLHSKILCEPFFQNEYFHFNQKRRREDMIFCRIMQMEWLYGWKVKFFCVLKFDKLFPRTYSEFSFFFGTKNTKEAFKHE